MRRVLGIAAMVAVAMTSMAGCATLQGGASTAEKAVVQVVVMNEIESSSDRAAKAKGVLEIVADTKVMMDVEGVTLADLKVKLMQRLVERELEPSRMLAASLLVDAVGKHVETKIGEGVLSPEKKVTVNVVLGWVEEAARFYVRDTA